LRAAAELQRSGLRYTVVRPGGLRSDGAPAPVVMRAGGAYGLPPRAWPSGAILRSQVADVCVEALVAPAAADAVVEARVGGGARLRSERSARLRHRCAVWLRRRCAAMRAR
jgi:hypothetical protein